MADNDVLLEHLEVLQVGILTAPSSIAMEVPYAVNYPMIRPFPTIWSIENRADVSQKCSWYSGSVGSLVSANRVIALAHANVREFEIERY